MKTVEKDLVWLPKDLCEKIKILEDPTSQECSDLIEQYIKDSKESYKMSLESLDEDLLIYRGLMMKVKKSFENASKVALAESYDLWEKYDEELPRTRGKIDNLLKLLEPLEHKLEYINKSINSINTYNIEKLVDLIQKLENIINCSGKTSDLMMFLMDNYKEKEK